MSFALAITALLGAAYAYLAARLVGGTIGAVLLAAPFICIWIVPVMYWGSPRSREGFFARLVHRASYLSMAWVSFVLVLTLARDLLLVATHWGAPLAATHAWVASAGVPVVFGGSLAAMALGAAAAFRGPRVESVDIALPDLHPDLDGYRIVQISDLHIGPNIGRRYVERVVAKARALKPDLIALTGDIVDGPIARLAPDVAPLAELARDGKAYFVLGNHDCYAGADVWVEHFRSLGMHVLLNSHEIIGHGPCTHGDSFAREWDALKQEFGDPRGLDSDECFARLLFCVALHLRPEALLLDEKGQELAHAFVVVDDEDQFRLFVGFRHGPILPYFCRPDMARGRFRGWRIRPALFS